METAVRRLDKELHDMKHALEKFTIEVEVHSMIIVYRMEFDKMRWKQIINFTQNSAVGCTQLGVFGRELGSPACFHM